MSNEGLKYHLPASTQYTDFRLYTRQVSSSSLSPYCSRRRSAFRLDFIVPRVFLFTPSIDQVYSHVHLAVLLFRVLYQKDIHRHKSHLNVKLV